MKKLTQKQAVDPKGNVWDTKALKELIATNDKAAIRALEIIYNRQTTDEKIDEETKYHNTIGFTGADAKILTSMYGFYQRNKYLSPKQMVVVKKKMKKYTAQLLDEMRAKAPQAVQTEMRFVQTIRMEK